MTPLPQVQVQRSHKPLNCIKSTIQFTETVLYVNRNTICCNMLKYYLIDPVAMVTGIYSLFLNLVDWS